jgi:undecaprenyl-diphosphatase
MSSIEAIILGIIQGLTEFLPVSSSGHIELGKLILGIQSQDNLLFSIVVHTATALSTVVVFRKEIWALLSGLFSFKWNDEWQFSMKIVLSMIPAAIVGLFFEDQLDSFFSGKAIFVGSMLLLTGVLLFLTTILEKKSNQKEVSFFHAILLGITQAIAILPGISRSGSTIAVALFLGVDREKAAKFSFLMVLPLILGAMLDKVKKYLENPSLSQDVEYLSLGLGFVAAFFTGWLACIWMINLVKKGKLIYFAIYCLLIGAIAIVVSM